MPSRASFSLFLYKVVAFYKQKSTHDASQKQVLASGMGPHGNEILWNQYMYFKFTIHVP